MTVSASLLSPDGIKEVISVSDGFRESKESYGDILRDLKRRGYRKIKDVINGVCFKDGVEVAEKSSATVMA